MLVGFVFSLHRVVLIVTLSVALVGTGFAHHLPTVADEGARAFALQTGISLSDLCSGEAGKSAHPGTDCQACQVTASAHVSPMTGVRIDVELSFHASVVAPLEVRGALHILDPAHGPQGPPVA